MPTAHHIEVCPRCYGQGAVNRQHGGYCGQLVAETCTLCKGKRVVSKIVTTTYEALPDKERPKRDNSSQGD